MLWAVVGMLLSCVRLVAHQDPLGEIHPLVRLEQNQFHVYFGDNREMRDGETIALFKRIYDASGSLVRDRTKAVLEKPSEDDTPFNLPLPEELTGCWQKFGGAFYIVPQWPRKHAGRPFYLVATSERHLRHELQWPLANVDVVEDFVVDESSIVLLVTRIVTKAPRETDLWLCHFNKHSGELLRELRVGGPSFIYSFPGTSRLLQRGDRILFVWNEATDNRERLHVARYELSTRKLDDHALPFPSTWNISISIEVLGNTLCLAYHGVSTQLAVHFLRLDELFAHSH